MSEVLQIGRAIGLRHHDPVRCCPHHGGEVVELTFIQRVDTNS
jgi:hypothetical protein